MKSNSTDLLEQVLLDDPLRDDLAFFYWDYTRKVYVVEVSGWVVFAPRTLAELRAFCLMHNGRIEQSFIQ